LILNIIQAVTIVVDFKELTDKFVICAGGFDLGQINGIELDTNTWLVTHLHVKLSKSASEDLGFKKRFGSSTVCIPVSLVATIGDNILLNKTLDELTKSPKISECK
jgi:sporulation protein YlmC with PRC-barrel domain